VPLFGVITREHEGAHTITISPPSRSAVPGSPWTVDAQELDQVVRTSAAWTGKSANDGAQKLHWIMMNLHICLILHSGRVQLA